MRVCVWGGAWCVCGRRGMPCLLQRGAIPQGEGCFRVVGRQRGSGRDTPKRVISCEVGMGWNSRLLSCNYFFVDHLGSSKLGSETIGHFIFSFCMTKKSNQHSTYFSATTPHFMTKHTHYNTMYICLTKRRSKNTYYFDYYLQVSTCNRNM